MAHKNFSSILIVAFALLGLAASVSAQGKKTALAVRPRMEPRAAEASQARKTRDDLVRATEEYKASLQHLLALREENVLKAVAQLDKIKGLYTDGLISKRELEESERALAELRAGADEVRLRVVAADQLLAESLVEDEVVVAGPVAPVAGPRAGYLKKVAYVRSSGFGNWSLSDASKIEGFFASKFGRRLPVSAFGQSELHNRWGFDHRHALDVGLHPDSPEGQALIAYLQNAGIPFIAFRRAVPGSASAPHIHIGRPSQRLFTR